MNVTYYQHLRLADSNIGGIS